MHPLSVLADKAIRSLHIQLERAEVEGTEIEVGKLLETIGWYETQRVYVERKSNDGN